MINYEKIKKKTKHDIRRGFSATKWFLLALIIGSCVGLVAGAFGFLLQKITTLRLNNPQFLYLLPVGAVLIMAMYQWILKKKDPGTNLVLSAIHSDEQIPLRMAPLIFVSTILTHLVGGSAGREGAALQLGGSIGNAFGRLFQIENKEDRNIMIMCGMSAAFSALFGTPIAAAIFSMEVVSVGIMHYAALLPCAVSSLLARAISSSLFGISSPGYDILKVPDFTLSSAAYISVLAMFCGAISILFCIILQQTNHLFQVLFHNIYIRAFVGGCLLLVMTLIVGSQTYNGTGTDMIAQCMDGKLHSGAFFLKIFFTAITLACGYKGGEIIPTFFIGASFGSMFGNLVGFAPSLCSAIGMGSLFCGVTNCPITSLLICFELFGPEGSPYFLLAVGFSYMVSGYYSLYSSQKIVYSKYKSNYIDKQAK